MNRTYLLKNIASIGIASFSAIAITAITSTKVQAATAYAYSQADIDTIITPFNFTIDFFGTETSDSAVVIDTPGGSISNIDPSDALQSYIGPAPAPSENFFSPKGQETPDYARGDVLIDSASTTFVSGLNLGEAYVATPTSPSTSLDQGEGDGEWEWVSNIFTVEEDGEENSGVAFDVNGSFDLIVEITNGDIDPGEAFAEAEFNYEIEINDTNGNAVFAAEFGEQLGLIEVEDESNSGIFNESNLAIVVGSGSLTDDGLFTELAPGDYNIVISAFEEATVNVSDNGRIPEPATIFGLLTVGGLGLGLKCKKRLLRVG